MIETTSARRQRGNAAMYVLLSILVVAGAAGAIYLLSQDEDQSMPVAAMPSQEQAALSAEPPAIKEVNMQEVEIDDTPARQGGTAQTQNGSQDEGEAGLFERGGRKIPLTDGLTGGSESLIGTQSSAPAGKSGKVHAVDAFDYGVLDGRVRVGVFGKGPIPDYRVRLSNDHYVIDMPGEFRYVENFSQALSIERFGVAQAHLMRYNRGMRMRIDVTPALQHEPYLIEDSRGLMIAFEPRKTN